MAKYNSWLKSTCHFLKQVEEEDCSRKVSLAAEAGQVASQAASSGFGCARTGKGSSLQVLLSPTHPFKGTLYPLYTHIYPNTCPLKQTSQQVRLNLPHHTPPLHQQQQSAALTQLELNTQDHLLAPYQSGALVFPSCFPATSHKGYL